MQIIISDDIYYIFLCNDNFYKNSLNFFTWVHKMYPCKICIIKNHIFPTKSNDGDNVGAPIFHFAGQTSPGCCATYCIA